MGRVRFCPYLSVHLFAITYHFTCIAADLRPFRPEKATVRAEPWANSICSYVHLCSSEEMNDSPSSRLAAHTVNTKSDGLRHPFWDGAALASASAMKGLEYENHLGPPAKLNGSVASPRHET